MQRVTAKTKSAASGSRRIRPLENRHFLLVEGSGERRRFCLDLLEKAGAEVTLERHALTGVVVAVSMPERFDALILDVNLPLSEIIEAGIALRSAGFDRPIIALVPRLESTGKYLHPAGCAIIQKNTKIASAFVGMVAGLIHSTPAALN